MLINTYPKPLKKKKHRAKNNPRPTIDSICEICGERFAELHEIFPGKNRQLSIKYKMQIHLCPLHHRIGHEAIHNNIIFRDKMQKKHQKKFNKMYPDLDFEKIFGKNYL